MSKVVGPLFSLDARGTIAKTITYGINQYGNWVRRIVKRKYTRSDAQDFIRDWFKWGIDVFKDMSQEERFLWNLALTNYKKYGSSMAENLHRMGRCLFLHRVLSTYSFDWDDSPFPPDLWQMFAKDEIDGYDQLMSDLETLTALTFCETVNPYFFKYLGVVQSPGHPGLGQPVAGIAASFGTAIAIHQGFYEGYSVYDKKDLIVHELTHAIMDQHGWNYGASVAASEQIANECATRVADGDLAPVYLYEGKALPELVDDSGCP